MPCFIFQAFCHNQEHRNSLIPQSHVVSDKHGDWTRKMKKLLLYTRMTWWVFFFLPAIKHVVVILYLLRQITHQEGAIIVATCCLIYTGFSSSQYSVIQGKRSTDMNCTVPEQMTQCSFSTLWCFLRHGGPLWPRRAWSHCARGMKV